MSISKSQITSLLQPVTTRIVEGYEQMKQIGDKLLNLHHPSSVMVGFIESILANASQLVMSDSTSRALTDDMLTETRDLLPTYDDMQLDVVVHEGCVFNSIDKTVTFIEHTFQTARYNYTMMALSIDDDGVTRYFPTGVHRDMVNEVFVVPTKAEMEANHNEDHVIALAWMDAKESGLLDKIQSIIADASSGIGLNYFFGNVLSFAADHAFDNNSSALLENYVNDFTTIPTHIKNLVLGVSLTNPIQLVNAITGYINQCQSAAAENDASIFSSTAIAMTTYVNGVILGALSVGIQILTAVATAISRIAGAILAAVGTVFSIFSNLFYRTQGANLNFGLDIKANHCFDFVVSQSTLTAGSLRTIMLSLGVNSLIITPKRCPSVFSCFLKTDDPSLVLVEERLSTDYDLSLAETIVSVPSAGSALVYGKSTGFIMPVDFGYTCGVYLSANTNSLACDSTDLAEQSYSPFNISRLSGLLNSVTGTLNVALARRLASAVVLWCYGILRDYLRQVQASMTGGYQGAIITFDRKLGTSSYSTDPYGLKVVADAFNKGLFALLKDTDATSSVLMSDVHGSVSKWSSKPTSYANYNGSYIQSWIENEFVACFNGLGWMDTVHSAIDLFDQLDVKNTYYLNDGSTTSSGVSRFIAQFYFDDSTLLNHIYVFTQGNYYLFLQYRKGYLDFWINNVTYEETYNFYQPVSGWISDGAIILPSLAWSAVVLSIIADVACLIGIAVLAAGALYGRAKISSYRSRKQAEVEANWYSYQDVLTNEYDDPSERKTALNQAWAKYNSSRIRYNILARLTGGTTLAKGLYDDQSSTSVIESIRSVLGGNSQVNLADVNTSVSSSERTIITAVDNAVTAINTASGNEFDGVNSELSVIHSLISG